MNKKKTILVCEGGSLRGMYTSGVIDTFMDENIHIDAIIGVSAGALFSPNYFSNQKGRALRYSKRFCNDKRNMSFRNFLFTGNLVSKQFAYYDITLKHDIFDNKTFMKNNTGFYAACTNVETGEAEYLEMHDIVKEMEILRATAAIPFVSQMVKLNGKKYLDGGVGDSIPVLQAKKMGYDKIIVVLTRDASYRKDPLSKAMEYLLKLRYWRYPKFIEAMMNRHNRYNQTLEQIQAMKNSHELFVISPSSPIQMHTIERDPDKLQSVYDLGVKDCKNLIHELKDYLSYD